MILKQWSEILRNVTMLSQLGLSFYHTASAVPGTLLVYYFQDRCRRLGLYSWYFSLGWADRRLWHIKFYLSVNKQEKEKHKK